MSGIQACNGWLGPAYCRNACREVPSSSGNQPSDRTSTADALASNVSSCLQIRSAAHSVL